MYLDRRTDRVIGIRPRFYPVGTFDETSDGNSNPQQVVFSEAIEAFKSPALIYSRVNLEEPEWWKKVTWPAPDAVRGKANSDSEVPNLSNCAGAGGLCWDSWRTFMQSHATRIVFARRARSSLA